MPTHQLVFGCAEAPARECSGDDDLQDFLTREGFGAYEINSGAQIVSDDMKLQISRMGMLPVLRCVSRDLNESEACLIQAKMLGASVACMRLGAANAEEEASRDLVQTVLTKFKDACINLRFEVHPSTIFANLGKTAHWCELFPEVNLALDAEMLLEESADTDEGSALQFPAVMSPHRSNLSGRESCSNGDAMRRRGGGCCLCSTSIYRILMRLTRWPPGNS
jgi:hypothetical protein